MMAVPSSRLVSSELQGLRAKYASKAQPRAIGHRAADAHDIPVLWRGSYYFRWRSCPCGSLLFPSPKSMVGVFSLVVQKNASDRPAACGYWVEMDQSLVIHLTLALTKHIELALVHTSFLVSPQKDTVCESTFACILSSLHMQLSNS
jgi:hypothetical protein